MITENKSYYNSLIVGIKEISNRRVLVERVDSSHNSILHIPNFEPSFDEVNQDSMNYVINKPKNIIALSLPVDRTNISNLSTYSLADGSKYVYSKKLDEFMLISNAYENDSNMIRIPKYIVGKTYRSGSVVTLDGTVFRSIIKTTSHPRSTNHKWDVVTEYDMFSNICEISAPSFSGYFDIADSFWYKHQMDIGTRDLFIEKFNTVVDATDLDMISDGVTIVSKKTGEIVTYSMVIDPSVMTIKEVSGKMNYNGAIDEVLEISLSIDNVDGTSEYVIELTDNVDSDNNGFVSYFSKINGWNVEKVESGEGYEFVVNTSDLSIDPVEIAKIDITFKWLSGEDLGIHTLSNLEIKYEELI